MVCMAVLVHGKTTEQTTHGWKPLTAAEVGVHSDLLPPLWACGEKENHSGQAIGHQGCSVHSSHKTERKKDRIGWSVIRHSIQRQDPSEQLLLNGPHLRSELINGLIYLSSHLLVIRPPAGTISSTYELLRGTLQRHPIRISAQ